LIHLVSTYRCSSAAGSGSPSVSQYIEYSSSTPPASAIAERPVGRPGFASIA